MLKIKDVVNCEDLTKVGFASFKVNREQTNYYFAVRRGGHVIIVNNITRRVMLDNIHENDTRLHANIKWQPKETLVEDGIFALTTAGMVDRVKEN